MPERLPRELRLFYDLAHVVAAGPYSANEIFDRICGEIRTDFGFDRTIVVRLDEEKQTVTIVAQEGAPDADRQELPLDRFPLLERALQDRRAVLARDVVAERAVPIPVAEHFGIVSAVAVPLLNEGRCLGFIAADRRAEPLELSENELSLLSALGLVAAVFVDKAEQYGELQVALEELRRLHDAKSDFISIASHELRTPISVVSGIAATLHLRGDDLTDEQRLELRRTLYEQTLRLRSLTEQLLDLSRLEAGRVRLAPETLRPRECFEELLPQICPERLSDVKIDIDPTIEVEADPVAFERVVSNLVINALRYGEPPVFVAGEANGTFRLTVEDHGEGVPDDLLPHLFERFTRGERSRADSRQGAGLGLCIARSYAEALGGRLEYEKAKPRGARFVLELPA